MKMKRKIFGALTAAAMCITMLPNVPSAPSAHAANVGDKLSVGNGQTQHKGNCDGYSYEVWLDTTGGSGSMTLGKGATFKAEWSASVSRGNFLARRGLDFGSSKKATAYDYIGMDYQATYKQTGSAQGNSRLCVYGWFQNRGASGNPPLVEYYIIEDWVDWCPDGNGTMVTIDNAQYKIFQNDHNGPSINSGNETFKQYFSVRQQRRTSGHITVSDHFKAWEKQGWGIGNLYEVALNAEGWQSSGVADVTMLDVYTDPNGGIDIPGVEPEDPIEPDDNGNYFFETFEDGAGDFTGRGGASVATDSKNYYGGSKSLSVTGRTDNWNGAEISLSTAAFQPGETYSFSGAVLQTSGEPVDMKMTLQYTDSSGTESYDEVALVSAKSGEWTKLENTAYKIPSGASNLKLYVEAPDSLTDFYIDNMAGSVKGTKADITTGGGKVDGASIVTSTTTTTTTTQPPTSDVKVSLYGDANCDGEVNLADAILIMQHLASPNKFELSPLGKANADVNMAGNGITNADALAIQKYCLELISKLPESVAPASSTTTTTTTSKTTTTTTTTTTQSNGVSNGKLMSKIKSEFTTNVPSNIKNYSDTGSYSKISYPSKATGTNKPAYVWLPKGYDKSKKYNVLYVNHGVMGNEGDMVSGWGVREMASYFIDKGEVDPFIVVFPQMYSAQGGGGAMGINMDVMDNYDRFLQDMTDSLMPYIEQNYSVNTGREHTAICGFSMGGRESLYLTISRPDLFGYCCASSPAPGIVPASDNFIANHLGSKKADGSRMTNSDFKISKNDMPYLLMIGGGTADGVVGDFPEKYHNLFTQNGTDHIWQSFPGAGHDSSVGLPMFYNFFRCLFKGNNV